MILVWVIALFFIALAAAIIALPIFGSPSIRLVVGEVAQQDVRAPRAVLYPSPILTEKARAAAAAAVPKVYAPPEMRVARQQVLLLRDILDFINAVQADPHATPVQQREDLAVIRDLPLTTDTIDLLLSFEEADWARVQSEALSVLEQVMRSEVREDQVEQARQAVMTRISVDLTEAQAQAVHTLVAGLVMPNSFYDEASTQAAREAARDAVTDVYKQVDQGAVIVARGQTVTPEAVETLQALDVLQPDRRWQELASAVLAVLITGALFALYMRRFHPEASWSPRQVLLLSLLFTVFLFVAKLMVPEHTVLPFLFPAAALSMLLTVFLGPQLAITVSVALAALVGYIGGNSLELTIYTAMGSIVAALLLGRAERVNQFFWAGLAAAVAHASIVLVFRFSDTDIDPLGLTQLLIASAANGVISASLTLVGFFLLGGLFDLTTSLQLIELARPNHPLLQYILRNAPGTYQHSLQVANLAEQAAERVGASASLIRVGALYHDAGKALHPEYFVENQLDGANIHDHLDPNTSAEIIISHVRDGIEMARRHRLPSRVRAFITEHHGTLKTAYQYQRALEAAGGDPSQVNASKFQYPGPRPQSKETALLMLADGCEAKARSDRPKSEEDLD
ncbi:MAG: HD family phosphohydrolase, partial [Anaerolineales bacterium]